MERDVWVTTQGWPNPSKRIIVHYFFYKTSVEGGAPRDLHKFDAQFYIIVVSITEFSL